MSVHDSLAADLPAAVLARKAVGLQTYGEPLTADTDVDLGAYEEEELLDALAYCRAQRERVERLRRRADELRAALEGLAARLEDQLTFTPTAWLRELAQEARSALEGGAA